MVVMDVWTACFVDSKYSMTPEEVARLTSAYQEIGLDVNLQDLHTEDEIIAACGHTDVLLCNGNPPISRKVLKSLPDVKVVQSFGIGSIPWTWKPLLNTEVVVLNQPGISDQELSVHTTD
jgi:phosphoglycerate dehydrogenase-like enzyme